MIESMRLRRISWLSAPLSLALLMAGCAPATLTSGSTSPNSDLGAANVTACSDLEDLWEEVDEWGTASGNTDTLGRPTATADPAPDFRVELDAIRQTTNGALRGALDEYYGYAPTGGQWWYANGTHQYGQASAVQSACEALGAPVDFPE